MYVYVYVYMYVYIYIYECTYLCVLMQAEGKANKREFF